MYALCDVNSMYASCEKVFDPSIRHRPVVVLTNLAPPSHTVVFKPLRG
jgi:nucleotidyltransferase/DNA polymerase involved in DNA repair